MSKVAIILALFLLGCDKDPEKEAYDACIEIIKSRLGGHVEVVDKSRKNYGSGKEFYFAWPSGSIAGGGRQVIKDKLTNSELILDASASCIGDLVAREITSVSVNSKDVITESVRF